MNKHWFAEIMAAVVLLSGTCFAEEGGVVSWDITALSAPPKKMDVPTRSAAGVIAMYYEGLPWKGRPTKVFAFYGLPKREYGKKVPAAVGGVARAPGRAAKAA